MTTKIDIPKSTVAIQPRIICAKQYFDHMETLKEANMSLAVIYIDRECGYSLEEATYLERASACLINS